MVGPRKLTGAFRSSGETAVSVAICAMLLLACRHVLADNPRTSGNYHTMGVILDVPSGYSPSQIGEVRLYDVTGPARRLLDPVQVASYNYYVCSVFDLKPGTTYNFRAEFYNTGATLVRTDTFSGTTRAEPGPRPAPVAEIHVSKTGSDAWPGTALQPKLTVAAALRAMTSAGMHVVIHEGIYHEGDLSVTNVGTPGAPLVIRGADGEIVIMDGSDEARMQTGWTDLGEGYYSRPHTGSSSLVAYRNRFTGKTLRAYPVRTSGEINSRFSGTFANSFAAYNMTAAFYCSGSEMTLYCPDFTPAGPVDMHVANRYRAFVNTNANNVIYENLTFRFYAGDAVYLDSSDDIIIRTCKFEYINTPIGVQRGSDRILVEHCMFLDDCNRWGFIPKTEEGADYHGSIETGAVITYSPYDGRGLVFRYNHVEGLFDGLHPVPTADSPTVVTSETDIYGNTFLNIADDVIEVDGYSRNVRIFENRMEDYLSAISIAQGMHGPTYVVRNLFAGCGESTCCSIDGYEGFPVKSNGGTEYGDTGRAFFYHNAVWTSVPQTSAFRVQSASWQELVMANNIWYGTERGWYVWYFPVSPVDMQNDIIYRESGPFLRAGHVEDPGTDYNTKAEAAVILPFLANSIEADPEFRDPANGDFQPAPDSPAIDGGIVIPGINDTRYSGAAPDIGPIETGRGTVAFDSTNSTVPESAGTLLIPVSLDAYSLSSVSVSYRATGGTAGNGTDYVLADGVLTFSPGETAKSIAVSLLPDSVPEGIETIAIVIGNPVNTSLGPVTNHTVVLVDDDDALPLVMFEQSSSVVPESQAQVAIDLALSKRYGMAVTAQVAVSVGGTTAQPSDYMFQSPVVFAPCQLTQSLAFAIAGDHDVEGDEAVALAITTVANGVAGSPSNHLLTIDDDDHRIIYVDDSATGSANGTSWNNAFPLLKDALAAARAYEEIWIAEGVYRPGSLRTDSFFPGTNSSLYGGFAGNETSRDQRDWKKHYSILSGDLNGNDTAGWSNRSDNAYHVMVLTNSSLLDGLVIRGGYADGAELWDPWTYTGQGGGVWANNIHGITLRNCVFNDNTAVAGGGAFLRKCARVHVMDCIFSGNRALEQGNNYGSGAICGIWGSEGDSALFQRCVFAGNSAPSGDGGAVLTTATGWEANFIDSLFAGNVAGGQGGAFYLRVYSSGLYNCTFSGNHPTAITSKDCTPVVRNSILWSNSTEVLTWNQSLVAEHSDIGTNTYAGISDNISTNPLWIPASSGKWVCVGKVT